MRLCELGVGDKVLLKSTYDEDKIVKITEVTDKEIKCDFLTFDRFNGNEIGTFNYIYFNHIFCLTPKLEKDIIDAEYRAQLLDEINSFNFAELSTVKIENIYKIIQYHKNK